MSELNDFKYYTDGNVNGGCNLLIPVKEKEPKDIIRDYLDIFNKILFCTPYFKPHRIQGIGRDNPIKILKEKKDFNFSEISVTIQNHLEDKPLEFYSIVIFMDGKFKLFNKSKKEKWIPIVCGFHLDRFTFHPEIHYPWKHKELDELDEKYWIQQFGQNWKIVLKDNRPGKIDFDLFYSLAFWTTSDIWTQLYYDKDNPKLFRINALRLKKYLDKIEDEMDAKLIDWEEQLSMLKEYFESL